MPLIPRLQIGVYIITNLVNGKVYIGSTTKTFTRRWQHHRSALRGNYHRNNHLQAAWNEYGEGSFQFSIKEECGPKECIVREQYWIERYSSSDRRYGYNICPTAGNTLGLKATDETKKRISQSQRALIKDPTMLEKRLSSLKIAKSSTIYSARKIRGLVLSAMNGGHKTQKALTALKHHQNRRKAGKLHYKKRSK